MTSDLIEAGVGQGTFTDITVNAWLAEIAEACWVSLHFDSPVVAGAYHSEFSIAEGGYTRVKAAFTEPSNRAMWNTNALRWRGLAANRIVYIGGWNARKNGDLVWWEKLPNPVRIQEGQGWAIAEERLALSFA